MNSSFTVIWALNRLIDRLKIHRLPFVSLISSVFSQVKMKKHFLVAASNMCVLLYFDCILKHPYQICYENTDIHVTLQCQLGCDKHASLTGFLLVSAPTLCEWHWALADLSDSGSTLALQSIPKVFNAGNYFFVVFVCAHGKCSCCCNRRVFPFTAV